MCHQKYLQHFLLMFLAVYLINEKASIVRFFDKLF